MRQLESFFWGVVAALGALVIQVIILTAIGVAQDPYAKTASTALLYTTGGIILAAFVEELFKYVVIVKRIEYLSLEKSFVVNSLIAGLGFFAVELALLHFKGVNLLANGALLAQIGIVHATTAGIIGYRIAVKNPKRIGTLVSTLVIVTFAHSAYNLLVNYRNVYTEVLIYALLGLLIIVTAANFFRISKQLAG